MMTFDIVRQPEIPKLLRREFVLELNASFRACEIGITLPTPWKRLVCFEVINFPLTAPATRLEKDHHVDVAAVVAGKANERREMSEFYLGMFF